MKVLEPRKKTSTKEGLKPMGWAQTKGLSPLKLTQMQLNNQLPIIRKKKSHTSHESKNNNVKLPT